MGSFYSDSLHPWGEGPVDVVAKHVHELLPGTVLDLGAGDGRNAVFLAKRGFRVIAVDVVEAALGELRRAAEAAGLAIETHVANIVDFPLADRYENVVCTLTLHFLEFEAALLLLTRLHERTAPGGCHVLTLFTSDGPLHRPGSPQFWPEPGGLQRLYGGWEVVYAARRLVTTVARDESGRAFEQPADELVVRRPS